MLTNEDLKKMQAIFATKEDLRAMESRLVSKAELKTELKELRLRIAEDLGDFVSDTLVPYFDKEVMPIKNDLKQIKSIPVIAHELKKKNK